MFWKTRARYQPGKLVGAFILVYGLCRFVVEFIREPDANSVGFAAATHLHMGQWLSLPMILGGLYLMLTAQAPPRARRADRRDRCASRDRRSERALRERDRAPKGRSRVEAYMEGATLLLCDPRSARRGAAISPPRPRSARCSAN